MGAGAADADAGGTTDGFVGAILVIPLQEIKCLSLPTVKPLETV